MFWVNKIKSRRHCLATGSGTSHCLGLLLILALVSCSTAHSQEPATGEASPVEIGPGGRIIRENSMHPAAADGEQFHLHFLWESRYLAEGRDSLDGGSLLSTSTELSLGPITFAPWFAYGPDSDYSELNLNLVYGHQLTDALELYVGYTHLQFPADQEYDNEIGAGLAFGGLPWFDLVGDAYYSFQANGAYFEVGAVREFPLTDDLMLGAFAMVGMNGGYVPDGHPGADYFSSGLELQWAMLPRLTFTSFAGYSWAIDRDPVHYEEDDLLGNFFWASLGFQVRF